MSTVAPKVPTRSTAEMIDAYSVSWETFWDLSTIPHAEFYREAQRRMVAAHKTKPSARVLRPCPHCSLEFGANELKKHKGVCPSNPRVQRVIAAQEPPK